MTAIFKPGDLVTLKSGGPTMTIDAVNTDIFDDHKITGILCVWFKGEKLERVRFDHRAIEPVELAKLDNRTEEATLPDASGKYSAALDEMVNAMNHAAGEMYYAAPLGPKKRKAARAPKNGTVSDPSGNFPNSRPRSPSS